VVILRDVESIRGTFERICQINDDESYRLEITLICPYIKTKSEDYISS